MEQANQQICSMPDDLSILCIVILFVDRSVVWRRPTNVCAVCPTSKRSRALISVLLVDWSVVEQANQWLCSMPDNPPISCTDKMVWNRPSNGYAVCPTTHRSRALICVLFVDRSVVEQANQWLRSMPQFSAVKCETVEHKLNPTDFSLDPDICLQHFSSHGKNVYIKGLRYASLVL